MLELARRGQVVGVDVGVQGIGEFQPQFLQNQQVSLQRIEYRIQQHGLPGFLAGEKIGVSARFLFIELAKNHHLLRILGIIEN
ncbi:hypothetical protein [Thermithiobacillus plumbiphilus]|uniref:Uncharacterized protein n=1 Tax=Thermithiobacillus plumbiphilus TaxID=1729899 RepID=A0ABU9DB57_9PROT